MAPTSSLSCRDILSAITENMKVTVRAKESGHGRGRPRESAGGTGKRRAERDAKENREAGKSEAKASVNSPSRRRSKRRRRNRTRDEKTAVSSSYSFPHLGFKPLPIWFKAVLICILNEAERLTVEFSMLEANCSNIQALIITNTAAGPLLIRPGNMLPYLYELCTLKEVSECLLMLEVTSACVGMSVHTHLHLLYLL